jgi:hypothetical protein
VVVDGGVDVVEAHAVAGGPAGLAAQDLVTAAVGDPAEFLDVPVDQLAGAVAFVAADDLSGGPVQEGQAVQAVADQDAVHGRGGQAQDRTDAGRAELAVLTQTAHAGLDRPCRAVRCRAVRCRARTAGPIVQSRLAFGPPAAHPHVRGDAGDAHLGGNMSDRTTGADTFDQQPPATDGQPGITVEHEGLRAVKIRHLHHTRRPSP